MAWVYLDDKFPEHPKVVAAGDEAAWLYVCGLAYTNRNLTDGRIPVAAVRRLTGFSRPDKLAERLVDVGLWEKDGEGFAIHDYHEMNESAAEALAKKQARSEKAKHAAEHRWRKGRASPGAMLHACSEHPPEQQVEHAQSNAKTMLGDAPYPKPHNSHLPTTETRLASGVAAAPDGAGEEMLEAELPWPVAPPDDPAVARLVALFGASPRWTSDAALTVGWARQHVDERVLDEAIGRVEGAETKPRSMAWVRTAIRRTAEARGVTVPEFGATDSKRITERRT